MAIIRRNNYVCATLGTCYSVWMTVWYAGWIPPCIPNSHPHRVTNTKCRIGTVISPDDGHIVARNLWRKEINILRKIVHQVGFIYTITSKSVESVFVYEDKISQLNDKILCHLCTKSVPILTQLFRPAQFLRFKNIYTKSLWIAFDTSRIHRASPCIFIQVQH